MTEGKRPGGLTALAVLNFVFGGKDCLNLLGLVVAWAVKHDKITLPDEEGMAEFKKAVAQLPDNIIYAMMGFAAVSAFVLIASGVGYLKQNRVWGRVLGSVGAIVGIGGTLAVAAMTVDAPGGGFALLTIAMLIYPVLTLILLNTTFREDFARDRAP